MEQFVRIKRHGSNYYRLMEVKRNRYLWTVVVMALLFVALLLSNALGFTELPLNRLVSNTGVFGLGHILGWRRMED